MKNPADVCSRGVFHPQLLETKKQNWLSGPDFLYDSNKIRNTHTIETLDESNQTSEKQKQL